MKNFLLGSDGSSGVRDQPTKLIGLRAQRFEEAHHNSGPEMHDEPHHFSLHHLLEFAELDI